VPASLKIGVLLLATIMLDRDLPQQCACQKQMYRSFRKKQAGDAGVRPIDRGANMGTELSIGNTDAPASGLSVGDRRAFDARLQRSCKARCYRSNALKDNGKSWRATLKIRLWQKRAGSVSSPGTS